MFVEKKKNKSGSTSVRVMKKLCGKRKCVKSIGCSSDEAEIAKFMKQGEKWVDEHQRGLSLFETDEDAMVAFYDTTTLYFESQEDDVRIPGYSKDGKSDNPQVVLGFWSALEAIPSATSCTRATSTKAQRCCPS